MKLGPNGAAAVERKVERRVSREPKEAIRWRSRSSGMWVLSLDCWAGGLGMTRMKGVRGTYEGAEEEVVVVCHGGVVEYCGLRWLAGCVDD